MKAFAGLVLLLLFLVELAAWAAFAVAGWSFAGPLLGIGLLVAVLVAWSQLASPHARFGGGGVRPVVKVLVFGGAVALLWGAGLVSWAVALLVMVAVVHALAALPSVRTVRMSIIRTSAPTASPD